MFNFYKNPTCLLPSLALIFSSFSCFLLAPSCLCLSSSRQLGRMGTGESSLLSYKGFSLFSRGFSLFCKGFYLDFLDTFDQDLLLSKEDGNFNVILIGFRSIVMLNSAVEVMVRDGVPRPTAASSPDEPKMPVSKFTSFSSRSKANSISVPAMIQNKAIRCSQQTFATPKIDERVEHTIDDMVCGRLILDGRAFRQTYVIRSFDSSPNMKLSIETIANYLQDATLNHLRSIGLSAKGFGSTQEMSKQGLIWVIYRTHIVVESYPSWNDVVQVDTWFHKPGKTTKLREWILCDCKSGKTLIRASSLFALMNSKTRRLAKFTKELAKELRPYHVLNQYPIIKDVGRKLSQVDIDEADYVQTGLTPSWNDLDANQHVNNAKYMDWLIQGIPRSILESHEQYSTILEYRKECFGDAVLQSFSRDINKGNHLPADNGRIEIEHSICLDNGQEAIRGRTIWKPKHTNSVQNWP